MKTIEVCFCESIYRETYIDVPDDVYEEMKNSTISTEAYDNINNICYKRMESGDFHYEDRDYYGITHIIDPENGDVLYN